MVGFGLSSTAFAAPTASLFIKGESTVENKIQANEVPELTWEPAVIPAPPGFPLSDPEADGAKMTLIDPETLPEYDDLTDEEREELNRVHGLSPILRNAAGLFTFFSVLGIGITYVNYRMELR